ncbi:Biotin carboxyl carrier protein of acetyl-CoA carboxylase [Acaryochloris thomasi RCC1774]|uniref:Biotin carboxyl carrier protein of acetyl-CoA carboxylase n=1 Tax=Acaryochloris thomasi RCC1774 TaxID=1764569 RepID=A0A2W1JQ56_9CYAN|nr:acetyl-CoA carboxylase biotin carboxyl carrier protein [Acaryochloris thomasi]PZD75386.1 Biotin carboxyl carrier protein of acetyl-CoA carboxylase [Acaryochloris thomasi RCC1774]
MDFDLKQLHELLAILNQTDVEELSLKSADFELNIRKGNSPAGTTVVTTSAPTPLEPKLEIVPDAEPAPASGPDKKWVKVTSPMVGTFYRAPAPEEPSFVETGDRVQKNQTLCIIEAMKLMNELEAELNGEVMEILVENGEPVEFGQTLMYINPAK